MIRNELLKLFKNSYVIGIVLICFVINIFILMCMNQDGYSSESYKNIWNDFSLSEKTVSETIIQIEKKLEKCKGENDEKNTLLYGRFLQELKRVDSYNSYREDIQNNAKRLSLLSVFNSDGFAKKNIKKTAVHFQKMPKISVEAGPSLGIERMFPLVTSILELICLLVLAYFLFIKEMENGILQFLYVSKKGRKPLYIAKITSHILVMILLTIVLYGSNYVVLSERYGMGNMKRAIQSVFEYYSCGSVLSVIQYGIYCLLLLIFLFAAIIFVIDTICILCKETIFSVLSIMIGSIIIVMLYRGISLNSSLSVIKYVNPIFCLNVGEVIGKYVNVNVFGLPIAYPYVIFGVYSMIGVVCFFIGGRAFCKPTLEKCNFFYKIRKKKKEYRKKEYGTFLFGYEWYKVWKTSHILVLFSVFLVISILFSYQEKIVFDDEDEYYYYTYVKELAGERTSKKISYIEKENIRFQNIRNKQEELLNKGKAEEASLLGESMRPYLGFQKLQQKEEYLQKTGCHYYIYEEGYKKLIDDSDNEENQFLFLIGMFLLVFSLSGVFTMEREGGQELLLEITRWGKKKRLQSKWIVSFFLCVGAFLVIYVPQLVIFGKIYGFGGVNKPLACIQNKGLFGTQIPIWFWLLYHYAFRLFSMLLFSGVVLVTSKKTKNRFITIILMSVLIFVFVLIKLL